MTNEKLTQTLTAIDPDQVKLDHTIKKILANKPILARIRRCASSKNTFECRGTERRYPGL